VASGPDRVRFCNNPVCERCDEHLRASEILQDAAGRDVCPACHERLAVQAARPRPPRLPARAARGTRPL
jgi:hypothetical protein